MITLGDPKTKTAMTLRRAADYLQTDYSDYNSRKAAKLLENISDLLIAEAQIDSWVVDLGFTGCQTDICK
jgi:hypothetical protein